MSYFDHMMGLRAGVADRYDGAVITHAAHGPEDAILQGPTMVLHPLEVRIPYPSWSGAAEHLAMDKNGEAWDERVDRARWARFNSGRRTPRRRHSGALLHTPPPAQEPPFGRAVRIGDQQTEIAGQLTPCYACGDATTRHQYWCPEAGGWWCQFCQAYTPTGPACMSCGRDREAAETWSPYGECPLCGATLEDTEGERATCACGWEEGE